MTNNHEMEKIKFSSFRGPIVEHEIATKDLTDIFDQVFHNFLNPSIAQIGPQRDKIICDFPQHELGIHLARMDDEILCMIWKLKSKKETCDSLVFNVRYHLRRQEYINTSGLDPIKSIFDKYILILNLMG